MTIRFWSKRQAKSEAPDFSRAEESWKYFFDTALCSLIDYEMESSELKRAVEKAGLVADESLSALEERWRR